MKFSDLEKDILNFWEKEAIFKKSLENRKDAPLFSFYDGPPFASGKPHYGHVLATAIKDSVLRYKTMQGYKIPRVVGWDCHGLPVENLIEKEIKVNSKREIEEDIGIEKFNKACRESVFRCVDDWKKTLTRVGRWADYEDDYATMDDNYIESVWWVFGRLWDNNLVYKDYRISPYCPRCGTPISNFEVNQGYQNTVDPSVFAKMKITEGKYKGVSLLAWTTTPWTLPGNVALVVGPSFDYVLVETNSEKLILAKERLEILEEEFKIIEEFKGKEIEGINYTPLYTFMAEANPDGIENSFKVYLADFVTLEEGTGIVHTAVMYGEDDFQLGKEKKLPFFHLVDEEGKFNEYVKKWKGQFVKQVDQKIIDDLSKRNLIYKKEDYEHSYPFCWRCDTPLLYYAFDSWYVKVTKIKKELIKNNQQIHWVPEYLKEGRFGNWLEGARDWSISRNRFWGAPIPVWECQNQNCENVKIIDSAEKLKKLSGKKITDFHRPFIDEIKFKCEKCSGEMKRVEEVFDCWFESGSMPYAQMHYPFEHKEKTEAGFSADFIAEGMDQTRGWFYTLHVLATALTLEDIGLGENKPAFKNVIVNGLVLDETGKKLSKKLRNYPEMDHIFDNYGVDSLRFFLLSSTKMGEDYRFSEDRVKETHRKVISTLWNSYIFFKTYTDEANFSESINPTHILNKWILSKVERTNKMVIYYMDDYKLTEATREIEKLIDDLSNWYIRRSRRKLQKPDSENEKKEFAEIFCYVLVKIVKMIAPYSPFISDYIYKDLTKKESVHLADFPQFNNCYINEELESQMEIVKELSTMALAERAKAGIKVRQPLSVLKINTDLSLELIEILKEEINVKEIIVSSDFELITELNDSLKKEGFLREIIRIIQDLRKKSNFTPDEEIIIYYSENLINIFEEEKEHIKSETLATDIKKGISESGQKKEITFENKTFFLSIEKAKS